MCARRLRQLVLKHSPNPRKAKVMDVPRRSARTDRPVAGVSYVAYNNRRP